MTPTRAIETGLALDGVFGGSPRCCSPTNLIDSQEPAIIALKAKTLREVDLRAPGYLK